jgi:hypothetical protein
VIVVREGTMSLGPKFTTVIEYVIVVPGMSVVCDPSVLEIDTSVKGRKRLESLVAAELESTHP